jgi:hypothetical protein
MDGQDDLWASGIWEFWIFASIFVSKWLSVGVQDLLPHVHFDQRSGSTSALQSFDVRAFQFAGARIDGLE